MATYRQESGELHIVLVKGDEVGTNIDFTPTDLTGYALDGEVVSLVSGETAGTITVTTLNATAGIVNLAMGEGVTGSLARGTYGWRLSWIAPGQVRRTALSGTLEVRSPVG